MIWPWHEFIPICVQNQQAKLMKKWKAKHNPIPDKTDNLKMKDFLRQKYVDKRWADEESESEDDSSDSEEQRKKKKKEKKKKAKKPKKKVVESSSSEEEEPAPKKS